MGSIHLCGNPGVSSTVKGDALESLPAKLVQEKDLTLDIDGVFGSVSNRSSHGEAGFSEDAEKAVHKRIRAEFMLDSIKTKKLN